MRFIVNMLIIAGLAYLLPGIHISGVGSLFCITLVLSILNACLMPIMEFFSLPFIVITGGLFYFILNAVMFHLADIMVDGFKIDNFKYTLLFSGIVTIVNSFRKK